MKLKDAIGYVYSYESEIFQKRQNFPENLEELIDNLLKILAKYIKKVFLLEEDNKKCAVMASFYIIERNQWLGVAEPVFIGITNERKKSIVHEFKNTLAKLQEENLTINIIFEKEFYERKKWYSFEFIFSNARFQLKKIILPFQPSITSFKRNINNEMLTHYQKLMDLEDFSQITGRFVRKFTQGLPAYQYNIPVLLGRLFFGHLVVDTNFEIKSPFEFVFLKMAAEKLFGYCAERLSLQRIEAMRKYALSSAVAAILMESYAHNIGAHGLEGLKLELNNQWNGIKELLNMKNQSILKAKTELLKSMIPLDKNIKNIINTHSNFIEYLSYLQGKSAFWSAIPRYGNLVGGKILNMWDLINDFAKNNLLCGSLGASEGFRGIQFFVKLNDAEPVDLGVSGIDGDLRYRFEEEDLLGTQSACVIAYKERTGIDLWDNGKEGKLNTLKNKLQEIKIFLPEGVVGQQAIYTIWENIIRNVKHCKNNSKEYIPFHIEIESKDKDIVIIKNWIDLDSREREKIEEAREWKKIEEAIEKMNSWEGVLDKDEKPNMGGTSQNILCAGMVYGSDIFKVEKLQKSDDKKIIRFEKNDKNKIVFSFKVWRSKEKIRYKEFKNKNFEEIGPLGRFRIIQLVNDGEEEEFLLNPFILRYVKSKEEKDYENLYKQWVSEWIMDDITVKIENTVIKKYSKGEIQDLPNGNSVDYYLYHREAEKDTTIQAKFEIPYKKNDVIGKISEEAAKNKNKLFELIEILGTSFEIFDNRLYKLSESITDLEKMKVKVHPEEKERLLKSSNQETFHFGIFHLSFLEQITEKNNEKAIEEFFTNKYKGYLERYRFIIITTGRGREWWGSLKDELKRKIKFVPIENLEKCFEDAKLLTPKTPCGGVKYALVKTIFGS